MGYLNKTSYMQTTNRTPLRFNARKVASGALLATTLRVALLLAIVFGSASSAKAEIEVVIAGSVEYVSSYRRAGVEYISFSELTALYGERLSWDIPGVSIDYRTGKNRMHFHLESQYLTLNDSVRNIIYPAELREGALFLPAVTFVPILNQARTERFLWDSSHRRLTVQSGAFNITDLIVSKKANGLLIEIQLTEKLTFQVTESEGNWINFSIPNGLINRSLIESRRSAREVRDINTFQFEKSAQVSIRLRKKPHAYTAKYNPDVGKIQLAIRNPNFKPKDQPPHAGQIGPDNTVDLIVIDAGHGGADNGAIGRRYTKEKDICLKIAQELAKLIRKDKLFRVTLTRDRDVYVPLEKRARIANEAHADLFISIHVNANVNRQARGSQVFFLAPAKTDAGRALAQAENASFLTHKNEIELDNDDDLAIIVNDMIQNSYEEVSADLSTIIQSEFDRALGIPSRGVDQAGFVVLNQVYMPSALIEVAFLSNAKEEKLLRNKKFRKKVAQSIYKALKRFKRKYESK